MSYKEETKYLKNLKRPILQKEAIDVLKKFSDDIGYSGTEYLLKKYTNKDDIRYQMRQIQNIIKNKKI